MARNENPPFARGQTFWAGTVPSDYASKDADLVGKVYYFEDRNWNDTFTKSFRSGRYVACMIARNGSGGALHAKDLAKLKTDGSAYEYLGVVMSNNPTLGDRAYPIDEFLPAAGVAANDLFFLVVGGPAMCVTDTAGDTNIPTGAYVVPGAGTAGRVVQQDSNPVAGTATFVQLNGAIGQAVLGVNATSANILIDVIPRITG